MAGLERDLIDRDLRSSIDDNVAGLLTSINHGSSSLNIDSGNLSHEGDENAPVQSAASDVPAHSGEGTLREQMSLLAIESSSHIDDGEYHQSIPSSRDKGKAPVRASDDPPDKTHPDGVEVFDGDVHSLTHTTNAPSTTENWETPKLHTASSTDTTGCISPDEASSEHNLQFEVRPASPGTSSKNTSVRSEDEPHATSSTDRKQKQKQQAEPEPEPEPRPIFPASSLNNNGGNEAQTFRPLQYGEPGWERSADRPPKKLPIRFKDAVGRKFVFPWEKANTWAGMERLIRSCFAHVDVIGPHVDAGHYDLLSNLPFSTPDVGVGTPFQTGSQNSSSTAPPAAGPVEPPIDGTPNEPPIPQAPTPPPAVPSTPAQQQSPVVILPELWDDLIEPGMFVSMHMWPMDHPPPPPPPPPLHHTSAPLAPGFAGGRGRGRGRGGGRGMGPILPQRPPGWIVLELKPRGKTRKRREGPPRIR
ncbi:hypothetical protein F5Y06DRAFT_267417 [Hypoxylon sp. FL0890]|nr:hypothetical protein F5Y06DRAFT_267417 [Hypoxylon sp. FL0890]